MWITLTCSSPMTGVKGQGKGWGRVTGWGSCRGLRVKGSGLRFSLRLRGIGQSNGRGHGEYLGSNNREGGL